MKVHINKLIIFPKAIDDLDSQINSTAFKTCLWLVSSRLRLAVGSWQLSVVGSDLYVAVCDMPVTRL